MNIYLDRQVGDGAVEKGYRFITLSKDDKVDGEEWTVVFDGLPMFEDGKAVTYTVREDRTAGYDEPVVTDVKPAVGVSEETLLTLALSLESKSEHPLAKAIVAEGKSGALPLPTRTISKPCRATALRAE